MEYLLFRLYGPMTSWGDIAVGESRHSHLAPSKSAVMGLLAAALGIRREEESLHLVLNQHYRMAAAVWQTGRLLRDYHTVQAADSTGRFRYRTRRDEIVLGKERLGTLLSTREYRTDALAWIALRAKDAVTDSTAPFSLAQLLAALTTPRFVLYLGRKSCPLAAPLAPTLIQAEGFYQAFRQYRPGPLSLADKRQKRGAENGNGHDTDELAGNGLADTGTDYFWEGEWQDFAATEPLTRSAVMTLTRHDRLLSRLRWQFAPRHSHHFHIEEGH